MMHQFLVMAAGLVASCQAQTAPGVTSLGPDACTASTEEVRAAKGAALMRLKSAMAASAPGEGRPQTGEMTDPRARLEAAREAAVENRTAAEKNRAEITLLPFEVVEAFGTEIGTAAMLPPPPCESESGYYLLLSEEEGAGRMIPVSGPDDPLVMAARR